MSDSTEAYERNIKPGDAIVTPDEQLWVVERVMLGSLAVTSAFRDSAGVIRRDIVEITSTVIPADHATKVADARSVGH